MFPSESLNKQNYYVNPIWEPDFSKSTSANPAENLEHSIYYWWWKYLGLHPTYKAELSVHYDLGDRLSEVCEKFGDVTGDFETWWKQENRGNSIFGSVRTMPAPQVITDLSKETEAAADEFLYLKLPMFATSKRDLKKFCNQAIKQYHPGKVGIPSQKWNEPIDFEVIGKPNVAALKKHYEVYRYKLDNPTKELWKVAKNVLTLDKKFSAPTPTVDLRNTLSGMVRKHLNIANVLIENVRAGRFPDYKKYPKTERGYPFIDEYYL